MRTTTPAILIIALTALGSGMPRSGQARPNPAATQSNYVAAMKRDLKSLATAEEAYFSDHSAYYSGSVSASEPLYGFSPSPNVTLTVVAGNGGEMWTATATHALSPARCTYHLPAAVVCDPAPPSDTSMFATPRGPGSAADGPSAPRSTAIGTADSVKIRAARSRSWQFDVRPSQPRCTVTGQVVGLSGGDKKVVVLIMTEFAYQDWLKNLPARTYYERELRTDIPFDVRIEGEG